MLTKDAEAEYRALVKEAAQASMTVEELFGIRYRLSSAVFNLLAELDATRERVAKLRRHIMYQRYADVAAKEAADAILKEAQP
jgi:hypothetical protein